MAVSNRDRIDRALELIGTALDAFITRAVASELPEGADWTAMLAAKDQQKGASASKKYNRVDPQNGLRVVSERVPGWYLERVAAPRSFAGRRELGAPSGPTTPWHRSSWYSIG